ncbi:MAG: putative L-threonine 3-dehydrogenase [Candidatus Bathyarchaeota archaeon BA1]|nr:MAG: putative L-threonine 3-dehydrogenase [Candidatus Bathyarchaeota archaeon BA1]
MKAVVYYDVDDFRVEDMPIPRIGPDEILVKVKACGLCTTDLFRAMYRKAKPGTVFGHEIAGEVAEVGLEVTKFEVGNRVAVLHHAPCGACYYCLHGQEPLCDQYRRTNVDPGGFAEYIRVIPELVRKVVVQILDEMTYEEATLIEPTACCVRAVTKSRIAPGDTVLVMGGGPLGLLNAQVAKYMGASQVIVSDHHDFRVNMAKELGIDHAFNAKKISIEEKVKELTEDRGADLVIIAVASTEAVHQGTKMVRWGGKICVFGDFRDVPQPNVEVDPKLMLRDDITLFGSWGCSPQDHQAAFNMIRMGRVKAKEMITHTFPIEQFTEALKVMAEKQCMRIVIKM